MQEKERGNNIGGNQYTDAIQKEMNLSGEQAEQLKRGEEIEGIQYEQVMPILASVNDDVGTEIQKTLDFFKQISSTDQLIDRLYLCGGASQVMNMKESLGERLDAEVEMLNPFRKITPGSREATEELIAEMTPTASVVGGCGRLKVGD